MVVLLVPSLVRYSYVRYLGIEDDGIGEEGVFLLGRFREKVEGGGAAVMV